MLVMCFHLFGSCEIKSRKQCRQSHKVSMLRNKILATLKYEVMQLNTFIMRVKTRYVLSGWRHDLSVKFTIYIL